MSILNQIAGAGRTNFDPFGSFQQGRQIKQRQNLLEGQQKVQESRLSLNEMLMNQRKAQVDQEREDQQRAGAIEQQRGILSAMLMDADTSNDASGLQGLARLPGGLKTAAEAQKLMQGPKDNTPAALREFEAYQGMTPEQRQMFDQYRTSKRPQTTVNINDEAQGIEANESAKLRAQSANTIIDDAAAAQQQLPRLRLLKDMTEKVETGRFTGARVELARALEGIGINTGKLSQITDAQMYDSQVKTLLLDQLQAQKGPQTEGDANRALATLPSIENTNTANKFIINSSIGIANRKIEQAEFIQNYAENNDGSTRGARRAWAQHLAKTPLFMQRQDGSFVFFHEAQEMLRDKGYDDDGIHEYWQNATK